jgi:signal transduction histidine kinase
MAIIKRRTHRALPPHPEVKQQTDLIAPLPALDAPVEDKKVTFFLTASHQLKSPVAIMQWCLQSVLEQQDVPKETAYLVRKALDQADGMSKLVGDMLQVFRLMHGNNQQAVMPVSLTPVIMSVLDQYELVAHNKGVHLVRGLLENLPPVLGRDTLLRQVVVNLVDNAIKYTPAGKQVLVTAETSGKHVVLTVQDEGIGIPESEQGRLFSEFFRGEEAKQVAYEGTGLGLVLVKQIVEQAGGEIHMSSQLHRGTTFRVTIPYLQP